MKPKAALQMLGLKSKPRTYGFEVVDLNLAEEGAIQLARWLHPRHPVIDVHQREVDELRKYLSPGDVAIDIGAHTGDTAVPMALAVGPQGCVLALEPNKYVYPVLEKNAELNPEKMNIIPLMFAATPEDGEMEFEYSDAGFCNGGRHEGMSMLRHGHPFKLTVQGKNLEAYLGREHPELMRQVRYIKVDAEGYDCTILMSLRELIASCKPYIRAEVYKKTSPAHRDRMYDFLDGCGYAIHHFDNDFQYAGELLGREDMTRWPHFDVFCIHREASEPKV